MSRLVVVSNRLPTLRASGSVMEPEVPVGGLASAVLGALRRSPGGLWFGWNGSIAESDRPMKPTRQSAGSFDLVGVPLTPSELQDYYLGFCNQALWPLLHCFQEKAKIRIRQEAAYRHVQKRFASALLPLLRDGDSVWVHDYHLLLLGQELRARGWTGRIGFFLHTPFPPYELWQVLPDARGTLEALLDYDVMGFHVPGFLDNYVYCCRRELGAKMHGATLAAAGRRQHVDIYPVGIDPAEFLPERAASVGQRAPRVLGLSLRGRRLILGVDRLDYTKGIPEKILAFEKFMVEHPEWRKKAVLVEIAAPSRTEVPDYAVQRQRIEALMGRVNGELGEHDWMPVRYLYRSYPRRFLARLYGEADVGLVTPLRDGMNLVAKEFVAAQDPVAPGVLVLSRCAGAAQELEEALIVNPYIAADVAGGIHTALSMSLEERRERHAALLARVLSSTASEWGRRFVADLEGSEGSVGAAGPSLETTHSTRTAHGHA